MKFLKSLTFLFLLSFFFTVSSQDKLIQNPDNEPTPVYPIPSERQIKWNETEFYAFFHFGMNTFTDKEWGYGDEDESLYNPKAKPDPRQWLEAAKAAGMKGGIAVAKHHDGFCLWPTETTSHSIINSGNEYSLVNIPEEFAKAARDLDMKYGFYISPWDRNSAFYGDSTDRYTREVFLPQCLELSRYGNEQFEMWFDGANGGDGYYGGARTKRSIDPKTYYNMEFLRDTLHKIMPDCVLWGMGGEARWVGNEAGYAGENNWSLGSGTAETGDINGKTWCAAEADAKATNKGWFWHEGQKMHSVDSLWTIYMETVGRNANLILNIPPDRYGRIPDDYAATLEEFGNLLNQRFANDLARKATVTASATRKNGVSRSYDATNLIDGDKDTYWATDDDVIDSVITFIFPETENVHMVSLMEYIRKGQRVKDFLVEISKDGEEWEPIPYKNTGTIGYKRIVPLDGSTSKFGDGFDIKGLRIHIKDAKAAPALHTVSIY